MLTDRRVIKRSEVCKTDTREEHQTTNAAEVPNQTSFFFSFFLLSISPHPVIREGRVNDIMNNNFFSFCLWWKIFKPLESSHHTVVTVAPSNINWFPPQGWRNKTESVNMNKNETKQNKKTSQTILTWNFYHFLCSSLLSWHGLTSVISPPPLPPVQCLNQGSVASASFKCLDDLKQVHTSIYRPIQVSTEHLRL